MDVCLVKNSVGPQKISTMKLLDKISDIWDYDFLGTELALLSSKKLERPSLVQESFRARPFYVFNNYIFYQNNVLDKISIFDKDYNLLIEVDSNYALSSYQVFNDDQLYVAAKITSGSTYKYTYLKFDFDVLEFTSERLEDAPLWHLHGEAYYYLNKKEKVLCKSSSLDNNDLLWKIELKDELPAVEKINGYSFEHEKFIFIFTTKQNILFISKDSGKLRNRLDFSRLKPCSFKICDQKILINEGTHLHKADFEGRIILSRPNHIPNSNKQFSCTGGMLLNKKKGYVRGIRNQTLYEFDIETLKYSSHFVLDNRPINSDLAWCINDSKLYLLDQAQTLYVFQL